MSNNKVTLPDEARILARAQLVHRRRSRTKLVMLLTERKRSLKRRNPQKKAGHKANY